MKTLRGLMWIEKTFGMTESTCRVKYGNTNIDKKAFKTLPELMSNVIIRR